MGKAKKAMNWTGATLDAVFKKVRHAPAGDSSLVTGPGAAGRHPRTGRPTPTRRASDPLTSTLWPAPPQVKPVLHVAVMPAIVGAGYMMCDPKPDVVAALMPL